MKIPIVSEYIERKRAEAQTKLKQLKDFYTYQDTYGYQKSIDGSEIFSNINVGESPIKSLRKKGKEFEKKYGWLWLEGIMKRSETFNNLSDEEKRKLVYKQVRNHREERAKNLLEKWCRDALPILENIIQENSQSIDGLEYYSSSTAGNYGGTYYKRVSIKDGEISTISFDNYGEHKNSTKKENIQKIASEILQPGVLKKETPWPRYNACYTENMERNRIVKEIKKKSGRNLKKDVSKLREQRRKFLLDFLPNMQSLSFWGGSNYS